ncbi:hypothetical protein XENTR_v10020164, partial [Xenopus tropicalis]
AVTVRAFFRALSPSPVLTGSNKLSCRFAAESDALGTMAGRRLILSLGAIVAGLTVRWAHCDAADSSSVCAAVNNITVPVGHSAALWAQVPPTALTVYGSQGLLFEFLNGQVTKKCRKCIYGNQTATLLHIQLNDAGTYYAKNGFNNITCIHLAVITPPPDADTTDTSPTQSTIEAAPKESSTTRPPDNSTNLQKTYNDFTSWERRHKGKETSVT